MTHPFVSPLYRPGLNEPKSTAHAYLRFPCLLCPSNEVLDFVKSGGPILTVDRTIFEIWLGGL